MTSTMTMTQTITNSIVYKK